MTRTLAVLALTLGTAAHAASPTVELRAYPTGLIASAGAAWPLDARTEWAAALLYNRAERGDAGKHDEESGDGFGVGVSVQRFVGSARQGWFYGARAELMQLDIDWRDLAASGQSEITVLQPTARAGYRYTPPAAAWRVELAASLGAEINLRTRGEAVGEGAIGLLGVTLQLE